MGVINKISPRVYKQVLMSLLSPSIILSLLTAMVGGKMNCGLNCYRWAKCMGQLDGSNRPGELGDTGIIVLNTCSPMEGKCNCAGSVLESLSSTTQPSKRKSKFTPKRTPRRKGRKFSEVKEKKSLVKTKRKYKRFQKKHFTEEETLNEATTDQTTTVKQQLVKNSRNRKRKFRMRKRL